MNDLLDDNNFFIFDDESVKISPVSKMPFRKKPRDSMNVRSKSNSNKSLPRTVHKWLPKLKPLAEPVAKWFPRIVQICLWIINSDCSNHMTGNRALLTNFVEKFLGTVRFGNNDFAVIAGYGDVVIDGVDLLTGDCSSNLYTIALNEVASNSLTCLLAKASSSQSWLWHQRLSHLNFATINNLVENNLVQGESSSSSLNDDVQQSPEEVILPQTNTQLISNNMVPNGDVASTSQNVFNARLEDAYFEAIPTPMVEQAKLKLDLVGKPVDHTNYRSMIGSLMYVTSSRPDIMFATCMCARYHDNPNEHQVSAVKRIFHYLKGTINLGLWYPKDSGFDLTAYSDADRAGCHLDRKSTSGSVQFLGDKLVCWSSKKQNCMSISTAESKYVAVSSYCA
nr:uncharacterized mitochondrial protein AtMg00810-like [Tanacetum cinerariifolium]